MDARGEEVASIATVSPGVLVRAPQSKPTASDLSILNNFINPKASNTPEITINEAKRARFRPCFLNESTNPGPACIPTVNMKSTIPIRSITGGIETPKCPNAKATKITADISNEMLAILTLPTIKPRVIITKSPRIGLFINSIKLLLG